MSELINNSKQRVEKLKELLLKLHKNQSVEETQKQVVEILGVIPYGEVVQAEQELIQEGLPATEIQKYCDLHSEALKDNIDLSHQKTVPEGHPVNTFKKENIAILGEVNAIKGILIGASVGKVDDYGKVMLDLRKHFNNLTDIEKHYSRKENLLFSFLEKHEITGPSTVMWGKDDEVREFLKSTLQIFEAAEKIDKESFNGFADLIFKPTINAIQEMTEKEEKILLPMSLDKLTELEWYEIYQQSEDIGYCIVAPEVKWDPELEGVHKPSEQGSKIRLETGSFSPEELEAVFNSLQVDLTFVDKNDNVKFFSHGPKRIFQRNKAILGRKVQYCHPPGSVHIVEKILDDFKNCKQNQAKFWIKFQGMYVHIAYYAVRNEKGEYLGTLEVTQDITEFKSTEGERRLLTYDE
jgi:uncharacterized protein